MRSRRVFIGGRGDVWSVSGLIEMKRQLLFDLRQLQAIQLIVL